MEPESNNVIYRYTSEEAVEDGWKVKLAPELYCTVNLARRLAPSADTEAGFDPERLKCLIVHFLHKRKDKIYFDPGATDYPEETGPDFVIYKVGSEVVWGIEDGEGLHFILPEDY